jgi:myo-inositol-1(or 4)-monophosphatase
MAAGSLLIVEAGGMVTDIHGDDQFMQQGNIIAAPPKVLSQMVQTLSPHMKRAAKADEEATGAVRAK